jgi:hypothetical protein
MSWVSGNPHHYNASVSKDWFHAESPDLYYVKEALMAVAFEQRTANLIAYQANVEESYVNARKAARSENASALNKQIIERLGLA